MYTFANSYAMEKPPETTLIYLVEVYLDGSDSLVYERCCCALYRNRFGVCEHDVLIRGAVWKRIMILSGRYEIFVWRDFV